MINRTYTKRTWQLFILWLVATLIFGMLQFWIECLYVLVAKNPLPEWKENLHGLCFTASGIVVSTAFAIWTSSEHIQLFDPWKVLIHILIPIILLMLGSLTYALIKIHDFNSDNVTSIILLIFFGSFIYGSWGTIELYSKESDES